MQVRLNGSLAVYQSMRSIGTGHGTPRDLYQGLEGHAEAKSEFVFQSKMAMALVSIEEQVRERKISAGRPRALTLELIGILQSLRSELTAELKKSRGLADNNRAFLIGLDQLFFQIDQAKADAGRTTVFDAKKGGFVPMYPMPKVGDLGRLKAELYDLQHVFDEQLDECSALERVDSRLSATLQRLRNGLKNPDLKRRQVLQALDSLNEGEPAGWLRSAPTPKMRIVVSQSMADMLKPTLETKTFGDGELYSRLNGFKPGPYDDILVFHRLYPDIHQEIFRLLQLLYGAKSKKPHSIKVVIPYVAYARADKIWLSGEIKSAGALVSLLKSYGVVELITWDCHFVKKEGRHYYEGLLVDNHSAARLFKEYYSAQIPDCKYVSPDLGSAYMVDFDGRSMHKRRGGYIQSGTVAKREIQSHELRFTVEGQDIVLLDDMIAGGGTMESGTRKCLEMGAKSVRVAATHGLFLKDAVQRLIDTGVSEIVTTDSIPNPYAKISLKNEIRRVGGYEPLSGAD